MEELKNLVTSFSNLPQKSQPEEVKEISIFSGSLTDQVIKNELKKIKIAFPDVTTDFLLLLSERVKENNLSDERLIQAVKHLIDNFTYKKPSIADIVSFDVKVKVYTWAEMTGMVTNEQARNDDFVAVDLGLDRPRWIMKTDFKKYGFREFEK